MVNGSLLNLLPAMSHCCEKHREVMFCMMRVFRGRLQLKLYSIECVQNVRIVYSISNILADKERQHILSSSQVGMYVTLGTVTLFASPMTVFKNGSERQVNIYTCVVLFFTSSRLFSLKIMFSDVRYIHNGHRRS